MDKTQEALKLALEWYDSGKEDRQEFETLMRRLLANAPDVLEQPSGEATLGQQQSADRGEPVAYAVYHRMGGSKSLHWPEQHSEDGDHNEYRLVPLYTAPPASKPLTDEQIEALPLPPSGTATVRDLVRIIEAAHGITGETK